MNGDRKPRDLGTPETDPLTQLCHDLRTPLNAIMGFSEMLDSEMLGEVGNQRYREYARHIRESGGQLRDIISEMLRILSDHGEAAAPKIKPVNPKSLIDACLGMVRPDAKAAGVRLSGRAAKDRVELLVDRKAVATILAGLVQDAIASAQRGDRITVTCGIAAAPHGIVYSVDGPAAPVDRAVKPVLAAGAAERPLRSPQYRDPAPAIWHWLVRLNGGRLDLKRTPGAAWSARLGFPEALLRRVRESAPGNSSQAGQ